MPRRRIVATRRRAGRSPVARLLLAVAVAVAVASTASAPVARAFATAETGTRRRPAPRRPRRTVESPRGGGSEARRRDDVDDDASIARPRSVGDAVRNLHGGKYQFSSAETQYLAGCSPTGREFAESLYASSSSSTGGAGDVDDNDEVFDEEELPRWARRLRDSSSPGGPRSDGGGDWTFAGTLAFDRDAATMRHVVTIRNEERSWEAFYAFVLPHDEGGGGGGGPPSFEASPKRGVLAPRGGSSNLCDETSPYPDAADISIEWNGGGGGIGAVPERGLSLLVVGTEAEVWRYRLLIR